MRQLSIILAEASVTGCHHRQTGPRNLEKKKKNRKTNTKQLVHFGYTTSGASITAAFAAFTHKEGREGGERASKRGAG